MIALPTVEFRQTYCLNPNGRVLIHNLYGDVRITAWDRDEVLVQAIKKSRDHRRLDDAQIVVDSSLDMLSIRTLYVGADAEHPASVEYHIMVPRSANLENIKLINGALSISGVSGPVKASSVNGSIHAEKIGGEADLSTVNGPLEVDFNRILPSRLIALSSVNGAIRLSIPSDADAILDARNLSGGIETEFGHAWRESSGQRLRTTVNRGGAQIQLHNVNGGISIHSWLKRT
ncbi:MAG TPA: DUF4097 family beta strand repeat-containing protein [Verrucomicrobiae bacterium]|nr:DUF4097 family beta strand repeat-containing protein [Verrucomicrobiae bacterium]